MPALKNWVVKCGLEGGLHRKAQGAKFNNIIKFYIYIYLLETQDFSEIGKNCFYFIKATMS